MVIFVRMPQIGERIYLLEGMAVDEARCAFVLRKSEVGHDRLDLSASWGKGAYAFFPKGYLLSSDKAVE